MRAAMPKPLAVLLAVLLLGACTRPYDEPLVIEMPREASGPVVGAPAFTGMETLVRDAAAQGRRLRFIWTHGMCSHHEGWAQTRTALVATALDATAEPQPGSGDGLTRVAFASPAGGFDGAFLVWSRLTDPWKWQNLGQLDPRGIENRPAGSIFAGYERASLNDQVRRTLMNNCLVDAVIYSGPNGDPIRQRMIAQVCAALGGMARAPGRAGERPGDCDLSAIDPAQPVVIVAESLGSKFFFDAVLAILEGAREADRMRLAQVIDSTRMIFLISNQIPLLDTAHRPPYGTAIGAAETGAVRPAPTSSLAAVLAAARAAREPRAFGAGPPAPGLTVVAYSDPNDLLSYPLRRDMLGTLEARLVNVIVSNAATVAGLLEWPVDAHCGYVGNRRVVGSLARGYAGTGPMPLSPPVTPDPCF
jgi:hypothetical protein